MPVAKCMAKFQLKFYIRCHQLRILSIGITIIRRISEKYYLNRSTLCGLLDLCEKYGWQRGWVRRVACSVASCLRSKILLRACLLLTAGV